MAHFTAFNIPRSFQLLNEVSLPPQTLKLSLLGKEAGSQNHLVSQTS